MLDKLKYFINNFIYPIARQEYKKKIDEFSDDTDIKQYIIRNDNKEHTIGYLKVYGDQPVQDIPVFLLFHAKDMTAYQYMSRLYESPSFTEQAEGKNFAIFIPEYSPYIPKDNTLGIFPSEPCEQTFKNDAINSYDFLVKTLNIRPENINIAGSSLGSYSALYLASQGKTAPIYILDHPIASFDNVIISQFPQYASYLGECVKWLRKTLYDDNFDNTEQIKTLTNKNILIIAGKEDEMLPREFHADILKGQYTNASVIEDRESGHFTPTLISWLLGSLQQNHSHVQQEKHRREQEASANVMVTI